MEPLLPGFRTGAEINWPKVAHHCRYRVKPLAKFFGVKLYALRKYCRHHFGCTPKQWLVHLRIEQCIQLAEAGRNQRTSLLHGWRAFLPRFQEAAGRAYLCSE